jgi:hexosaminidase
LSELSAQPLVLLPQPRLLEIALSGNYSFTAPLELHNFRNLFDALPDGLKLTIEDRAASITSPDKTLQAYTLTIGGDGIHIAARGESGAFYALCTLAQIQAQTGGALPHLRIEDSPDFARRGVMLDISRDKVPTLDTLKMLIDMLAAWKINELQLYTEHTYAYQNHRIVWENASPLTPEDLHTLDYYCREVGIDLVPNQNSFGHFHRWLMHEKYLHLAEVPEGFDWPIFISKRPFSLNATDQATFDLLNELYTELLPNFSSRYFNVGCDETFDLGKGRSKDEVERQGRGRVYVNYLKRVSDLVNQNGRIMQFWGDIIMEHPELVPELPPDAIALEWGYEADHPFDQNGERFASADIQFYFCPGTSSWISMVGRTQNALGNLQNAARNGIKHGAMGYLNTDWGDFGHWQALPTSYLGFAYGAALSWAYDANEKIDLPAALSRYAFRDDTGIMGRLAYEMGNVYLTMDDHRHYNGAHNVRALFSPLDTFEAQKWWDGAGDMQKVRAAIATMERLAGELTVARPADPLVIREYQLMVALWLHGCKRLLVESGDTVITREQLLAEILPLRDEFSAVWLARNRPGGLGDSLVRMDRLIQEYQQ